MAISKQDILEAIADMKVSELNQLVKDIEQKFGVSAITMTQPGEPSSSETKEESNEVDLILTDAGVSKVGVIKLIKKITGKGLMDSKKITDNLPAKIKEKISREEAEDLLKEIVEAGATGEIK